MALVRFDISLTLVSPFLTGGDTGPTFGLDMALPRSPGTGRVVVPGTLLRGAMRDALLSLCERGGGRVPGEADLTVEAIENLFGHESGRRSTKDGESRASGPESELPERGRLAFGDLEAQTTETTDGTLTRIHIDEALGTVKEGHLQVIEMPWSIGARVTFAGTVVATPGTDPALVMKALQRALAVIPALGAAKSAGFGAIACHHVEHRSVIGQTVTAVVESPIRRYRATLDFEGPFLVTADRVAPNVFSGSITVPGGVIKGAVARISDVTDSDTAFGRFLSRTVFGEAWPETPGKARPVTPPFSLCVYRNRQAGRLDDALFEGVPSPQGVAGATNVVGCFCVDWKEADSDAVDRAFPSMAARPTIRSVALELDRAVRTRTKIDYARGTADQGDEAEGGRLFVYDMVAPYLEGKAISWKFDVVLEDDGDLEHLRKLVGLEMLIGKLPTVARISAIEPIVESEKKPSTITKNLPIKPKGPITKSYALHLLTPALLTPLEDLRAAQGDAAVVYAASFRHIFDMDVELVRFYARQHLVGGWQALRYPARADHYDPWVLTEAGSVFLVRPPAEGQDEFQKTLETLLATGLPERGAPSGESWRTCPFPRVNGFGEVALWSPKSFRAPFS